MALSARGKMLLSVVGSLVGLSAGAALAAEELNLYSARHYDTDEALYREFEAQTGIEINRIDGDADELVERIKLEGDASPADVLLTVDAARLWRADQEGLLSPVDSEMLRERVPERFRHAEGHWYGFSSRARIIFYDKTRIDPALVRTYEDLAREELRSQVCIRSSSNIYNLSLLSSIVAHKGMEESQAWAEGVVANFARDPEGNDTAQIKAVAAGACGVALANSYYYARLVNSDDPADKEVVERVGFVIPNQDDRGAHLNISGAALLANAPHREAAVKFLEYLASDAAQLYFANGNNEFSVVEGLTEGNRAHEIYGDFEVDALNVNALGENQAMAAAIFDLVGWK